MVEDELGQDVGPEEGDASAGAVEVDVRKRDGVARDGAEVCRPSRQVVELAQERVEVALGLLPGVRLELAWSRPPATGGVAPDRARLRLDDEKAAVGVGDHEVRLAVGQLPVIAGAAGPTDVGEDAIAVSFGECRSDALLDTSFGFAARLPFRVVGRAGAFSAARP